MCKSSAKSMFREIIFFLHMIFRLTQGICLRSLVPKLLSNCNLNVFPTLRLTAQSFQDHLFGYLPKNNTTNSCATMLCRFRGDKIYHFNTIAYDLHSICIEYFNRVGVDFIHSFVSKKIFPNEIGPKSQTKQNLQV